MPQPPPKVDMTSLAARVRAARGAKPAKPKSASAGKARSLQRVNLTAGAGGPTTGVGGFGRGSATVPAKPKSATAAALHQRAPLRPSGAFTMESVLSKMKRRRKQHYLGHHSSSEGGTRTYHEQVLVIEAQASQHRESKKRTMFEKNRAKEKAAAQAAAKAAEQREDVAIDVEQSAALLGGAPDGGDAEEEPANGGRHRRRALADRHEATRSSVLDSMDTDVGKATRRARKETDTWRRKMLWKVVSLNQLWLMLALAAIFWALGTGLWWAAGRWDGGFLEASWTSCQFLFDPGNMAALKLPNERLAGFAITLCGLFFQAFIIATMTDKLSHSMEQLRSGRARVMESGHLLVLGWNTSAEFVVNELCLVCKASADRSKVVVILFDHPTDYAEMEQSANDIGDETGVRVICRRGCRYERPDLKRVGLFDASAVVVLSDPIRPDSADALSLRTLMMIRSIYSELKDKAHQAVSIPRLSVEVLDSENLPLLSDVGGTKSTVVAVQSLIDKIVASSSVQAGLMEVWEELLGFEGMSFYIIPMTHDPDDHNHRDKAGAEWREQLAGKPFGLLLASFTSAIPVGVLFAGESEFCLNPDNSQIVGKDDMVVFVASNDHTASWGFSGGAQVPSEYHMPASPRAARAGEGGARTARRAARVQAKTKTLLIGFDEHAVDLIFELSQTFAEGSEIHIVATDTVETRTECIEQQADTAAGKAVRATHPECPAYEYWVQPIEVSGKTLVLHHHVGDKSAWNTYMYEHPGFAVPGDEPWLLPIPEYTLVVLISDQFEDETGAECDARTLQSLLMIRHMQKLVGVVSTDTGMAVSSASSPSRRKSFVEMAAKAAKGRRTTCTVICEIVEKSTDTMIDECSQLRGLATYTRRNKLVGSLLSLFAIKEPGFLSIVVQLLAITDSASIELDNVSTYGLVPGLYSWRRLAAAVRGSGDIFLGLWDKDTMTPHLNEGARYKGENQLKIAEDTMFVVVGGHSANRGRRWGGGGHRREAPRDGPAPESPPLQRGPGSAPSMAMAPRGATARSHKHRYTKVKAGDVARERGR